ncbi:chlorite dismutase [Methylobacterium sp. J-072]|uniref:chlorite dismutase n=1 Tax=Methylobacterium sp. J-072 TaxID=2836651 RepID=UPI001FBBA340|nr:chlorite dismutase [Methylobacterium sp. J-072]MCJ2092058.1 chlorite dismutase [Methylobacterium sp. J-072]
MVCTIVFAGGDQGLWRVTNTATVIGDPLPPAERLAIVPFGPEILSSSVWRLRGAVSNLRYTTRSEAADLRALQPPLHRSTALRAALIPIRKTQAWWDLAQDERRGIFEETSHHTALGLGVLPAIARRLHHSRDLGEPFDFLTWFEFAPEHEASFDALLDMLRATHEWTYVAREVDIRLTRDMGP